MIVVRIELWPGGHEVNKREIGAVVIANTGTGGARDGNYAATLAARGQRAVPVRARRPWRWGAVLDFPRKRLGPYDLLLRALLVCVGDRNRGAIRAALDQPTRRTHS